MKKGKNKESSNNQFNWAGTLFLEKLEYKANMVLEIHLVAGKTEPLEDLFVGKVNLGPVHPVVWNPSKKVIVRFFQPLAFQRLDESFADEKGEDYMGRGERFGTYADSEYLRYYTKVTFGIVDEPIHHYCLTCSDDIISILSTEEPEIEYVSADDDFSNEEE